LLKQPIYALFVLGDFGERNEKENVGRERMERKKRRKT